MTFRFLRDRRGAVSVLSAVIFPVLVGALGLVADYGYALVGKTENQRVADMAAYAGALAYNSTSSTSSMTSAITNVITLNGVPSSAVTSSLTTSPSGDGNQAVQVRIETTDPLHIADALGGVRSLTLGGLAYAELKSATPGCIIALSTSGTGVTLSGGTSLTSSSCAIDSNNTVSVPCGTSITTIAVNYDSSSVPSQPCSGIQPPSGTASVKFKNTKTSDPLSGSTEVSAATARITTVAAETGPSGPTGGTADTFGYSGTPTLPSGCSGVFSSPTWTVTCSGAGPFNFGAITVSGGIKLVVTNANTAATYNINGGINTGGGTTTTFVAGTYNIGRASSSCNGGGDYSICNTGTTLTFGGPSTFVLQGGVYNSGGATLTMGSGTTNSFNFGPSSDGNAVYVAGGSTTVFADATGTSDLFQMVGNFNVASGGGSCVTVSAASQHDINGYFSVAGGVTLGTGTYTVNGYVGLGANGGGDVSCNGTTVGMSGTGVTFVISGTSTPSSGTCSGQAFCVAAGYNHVTLTAPSSGTLSQLLVVGPTSTSNTTGAAFAEGAAATSLSGTFYFPNGPISLSGGASVGNGSSQCLEMIGSQITLSGGTALASTCISGGASSAAVVLVQ